MLLLGSLLALQVGSADCPTFGHVKYLHAECSPGCITLPELRCRSACTKSHQATWLQETCLAEEGNRPIDIDSAGILR